jgi:hypothetical protein
VIEVPYETYCRFGTDLTQQSKIKWQYAQPGALSLGIPSPFVSRRWDSWETWPELGELQDAQRKYLRTGQTSLAPGTAAPCGDPAVWANGYPGTVPPDYPRTGLSFSACCGWLLDFLGRPTLGLVPQPLPLPLVVDNTDIELSGDSGGPLLAV